MFLIINGLVADLIKLIFILARITASNFSCKTGNYRYRYVNFLLIGYDQFKCYLGMTNLYFLSDYNEEIAFSFLNLHKTLILINLLINKNQID